MLSRSEKLRFQRFFKNAKIYKRHLAAWVDTPAPVIFNTVHYTEVQLYGDGILSGDSDRIKCDAAKYVNNILRGMGNG